MRSRLLPLWLALLALIGLAACAAQPAAPVELPLAKDQPTFLFFYTDN
jgi:curli biogenesis system outer membrane secretion channel CsgG